DLPERGVIDGLHICKIRPQLAKIRQFAGKCHEAPDGGYVQITRIEALETFEACNTGNVVVRQGVLNAYAGILRELIDNELDIVSARVSPNQRLKIARPAQSQS